MARWSEIEAEAPELARKARGYLELRTHKTLATLRADGSPRISGTEATFFDGDLWFGSMWQARKARDLQRDPRFALHGGSVDPPEWRGDAKLSGRVEEITDPGRVAEVIGAAGGAPPGPSHVFRADIAELSVVALGEPADHLVIDIWSEGKGVRSMRRA